MIIMADETKSKVVAKTEDVKAVTKEASPKKTVTKKEKAVKQKVEKKAKAAKPVRQIKKIEAAPLIDPWSILRHPYLTEKSIGMIESKNALVFIVDARVSKRQVRWAVERAFGVPVAAVNTLNDHQNRKKAFVRLAQENAAADIATRMGMI